ncbi:MAG: ABC transporter ATP-binding protein [Gaiella sp.]
MIRLEHITAAPGGVPVLTDLSLEVAPGETLALLGPSGSGKSTLLRVVAGLLRPAAGRVHLGGRDVTGEPAHRRSVGLVFQDGVLFPHLDVAGNVAFGLPQPRHGAGRIDEVLRMVGLPGFERRRVATLSGGEAQRVALARALAPQPSVLLLDEPLSALDGPLRRRLQSDLESIFRHADITAVHVTHDVAEAFALGDRVALIRTGRVVQVARPEQLWRQPASGWVAEFIGRGNVTRHAGRSVSIAPEAITITAGGDATVEEVERDGPLVRVAVRERDGRRLVAALATSSTPRTGDRVTVAIDSAGIAELLDD